MFGWFKKKRSARDRVDLTRQDPLTLIPRIKTTRFTKNLTERRLPADEFPYTVSLTADLVVTYAFDMPGMFVMASAPAIAKSGLTLDQVPSQAITNLKRLLPEVRCDGIGPILQVVTGDHLEACTLLLDEMWNQIALQTEGEVVVALPNRDKLFFCGSKSSEGLLTLRAVSAAARDGDKTHALTEQLLVWRDRRWQPFATGSEDAAQLSTLESDPDFDDEDFDEEEFDDEESEFGPHVVFVAVTLREYIAPFDRWRRYDDPLEEALGDHDVGMLPEGGAPPSKHFKSEFATLKFKIYVDVEQGLNVARGLLEARGAPKGSVFSYCLNGQDRKLEFGFTECLAIFLDFGGRPKNVDHSVGVQGLTDQFVGVLSSTSLGELHSFWSTPDEVAILIYGPDAEALFIALEPTLRTHALCPNARIVLRYGDTGMAARELRIQSGPAHA